MPKLLFSKKEQLARFRFDEKAALLEKKRKQEALLGSNEWLDEDAHLLHTPCLLFDLDPSLEETWGESDRREMRLKQQLRREKLSPKHILNDIDEKKDKKGKGNKTDFSNLGIGTLESIIKYGNNKLIISAAKAALEKKLRSE